MEVVTKKQLVDRLWNGKAVGDDALTSCVQELRRALGDDPRSPRFVETRHRRGYRLLLPVTSAAIATGPALPPPLDKPSIAVLPFRNGSGDPEQEYFADGLAEDLITGLSRVSWLFVIARDSSFVFRGEQVDARTIGDRLGVRYLVEGSVRRAGPRLRLTVQLIEAATGNHLWADKFDGSLEDVFDFQDRTVVSLVGAMEPKLRTAEILRARRKRPENLDAFDLYLQAQPRLASFSPQGIAEAIELFGRAVALSPDYAQALAHAAICRVVRPTLGHSPDPDRDFLEAAELSRRALESDPTDTIALQVAAFVAVMVDRDYETGWDLVNKSLAINPNDTRTWNRLGWINAWAGEVEPAITAFKTVMRLSRSIRCGVSVPGSGWPPPYAGVGVPKKRCPGFDRFSRSAPTMRAFISCSLRRCGCPVGRGRRGRPREITSRWCRGSLYATRERSARFEGRPDTSSFSTPCARLACRSDDWNACPLHG